jgi:hypothetical protein
MQFVRNGPDIPERLLQAHEDGLVVFFCGAGISYPAGLPGFKGLVDEIYRLVGTTLTPIENEAYTRGQYDATLDLLERRLPGQRLAVRTALIKVLKPKLRRKGATDTHDALLQLARNREGALRLVTTNFDRIFQRLTVRTKPAVAAYPAPLLPIPKNSRWNGLVYLHGLLPEQPEESALNRLVLTSGDFGLAYLTERWAARFVSELFRNYIVCFVGYSINDPVLRYMMDALAADRMLGEVTPLAYALGDCAPGQEKATTIEWEAKGVEPILYEVPAGTYDHSALHRTLKAWASTYRDGILGKERIVVDYSMTHPSSSTQQDDFVGRMLWALSHDSGLPAQRFAKYDPVPSLDWLEAFATDRYQHGDLARFGVSPHVEADNKLNFSLFRRPAPYTRAPWMAMITGSMMDSQWDDVMFQMARWLVRHLNDPVLVVWLAQQGGQLHNRFVWLIEAELDKLAKLERDGNTAQLDHIRSNAPNAIPRPLMRTLWRLLLTGRVKSPSRDLDLHQWKNRLKYDGLTATLRLELRKLLTPQFTLEKPFHWGEDDSDADEPEQLKKLVDWKLVLAANHVHSSLNDLQTSESWQSALPSLIDDFQQLLRDALDLSRELSGANERSDRSYWDLPSISPHIQNPGFQDWVVLIELLRDAWLAIYRQDPLRAGYIVQSWLYQPYPTFRRLALFAATHDGVAPNGAWVNWLLNDNDWWLWSVESQRETIRLLVLQGLHLPDDTRIRLEASILIGPPRNMFREDIEPRHWQDLADHSVWLRLVKLESSGIQLGEDARAKLASISTAHPEWQLAANERDEFSHWISGTGDPDYEDQLQIERAPRNRRDLVDWLQRPTSTHPFYKDTWHETCRERFFACTMALCDLARKNHWPTARWREALQAWSNEKLVLRSWRFVAPLMLTMPEKELQELSHSATCWLEAAAKVLDLDQHEAIFLDLCRRLMELPHKDENGVETNQPYMLAINHPIGHVTQALLHFWLRRKPNDNEGLRPNDLNSLFTQLCDIQVVQYRHGRVILASRLIPFFRVDCAWTQTYLLPLFDWSSSTIEAHSVWEGFLGSPRFYRPLLAAFKANLLETAHHYNELGGFGRQYAAFLTYVALDPADTFTTEELNDAFSALPQDGLQDSARALVSALEGAGEQCEQYWMNRVQPFWEKIWPKYRDLISKAIAEQLALLAIAARGEFPAALSCIQDWLQPLEHPNFIVHQLNESRLANRFHKESLGLLDTIINDHFWAQSDFDECLNAIVKAWPEAQQDHRYQRLSLRKRNR